MGTAVGLTERLAEAVLAGEGSLERVELERRVRELARVEAPLAGPEDLGRVVDEIVGMGVVEELLRDPSVSDVLINGADEVWVERLGSLERAPIRYGSAAAVVAAVERVITPLGLRLDRSSPTVDARLADGSRIHAVIPPAAVDGPVVAIRRFTETISSLEQLVVAGAASGEQVARLERLVVDRKNVIVSGGTGSGKTTLLNLLSRSIPSTERVVVVEDASELRLQGHVVRLEARPPNIEGGGEITVRQLLRSALRLRPDRIVLGEVRGAEAIELLTALNTGHSGSMSTVHANSPEEALWRLETLALSGSARPSEKAVRRQLSSAIDVIVQLERRDGRRRVVAIEETGR